LPDPVAPSNFTVTWKTTASETPVVIEVTRSWSPVGVDRFYQLLRDNYLDCAAFFRVVPGFVAQLGIAAEPAETAKWDVRIKDDPVVRSNVKGTLSFATAGPNTRTTQIFVNLADNAGLDSQGFSPFGRVVSGMDVLGEAVTNPTPGQSGGADQQQYEQKGNEWILQQYPDIDLVLTATVGQDPDNKDSSSDSGSSSGHDPSNSRTHEQPEKTWGPTWLLVAGETIMLILILVAVP
jgi:peptidyl-prolyl cis-trans isomerase A (cyclophilin A)